eukprot:4577682-Pleurochrysis_carterae.AAC.1
MSYSAPASQPALWVNLASASLHTTHSSEIVLLIGSPDRSTQGGGVHWRIHRSLINACLHPNLQRASGLRSGTAVAAALNSSLQNGCEDSRMSHSGP